MIKHKESHMDHGFTQEQWDYIFKKFEGRDAFFIETFELPENLGTVTTELYGPSAGDPPVFEADVHYAPRGERAWKSRMVKRPRRATRFVRVIAGPHSAPCTRCDGFGNWYPDGGLNSITPCECGDGKIKHPCVLYTAYGVTSLDMPASPREPGDIRKQLEEMEAKRPALGYNGEEHDKLYAEIVALREKRSEADAFWAIHALAE